MTQALQRFDVAALPATPWKNGGGSTREIASWPPGAGFDAFDWRVSIASIAASGPFSVFAGVDRSIMLLDGDGVHLQGPGLDHHLDQPHQPFFFSGDAAIDCTLVGGVSTDFNVMSRRERGQFRVSVLHQSESWCASFGLLMSLHGTWLVDGQPMMPGQGWWWASHAHVAVVVPQSSAAKLVALEWSARGAA